jgi:ribosomal protein L16/L10AE
MEMIRRVFVRTTLRMGKIWLNTKINFMLTSKSQGTRMGKGVGSTKE